MISRYETAAMAAIWNPEATFARWTRVEVAACQVMHSRGAIDAADWQAIASRAHHQSAARVQALEQTTHHDVVAFVSAVAESIGPAGRHIHRGLTSSDVVDTALALALLDSLDLIVAATTALRQALAERAVASKDLLCVGRTHGIHAEPTTFGLKLCGWVSELQRHLQRLQQARHNIAFGKLSGAVGSFSQTDPDFEAAVLQQLDLQPEPVATQVVPRDRHAEVFSTLAGLGGGLERFATELRHLQRTEVREVEEGFAAGQTGSSAMPHKRNPILCERLCGMARLLRGYAQAALENVALWHERDISHSAVERVIAPDALHVAHYMLLTLTRVVQQLRLYPQAMQHNLQRTGGLVYSQSVLGALLEAGMQRQQAYALVQRCAMQVWEGTAKDFPTALRAQPELTDLLPEARLQAALAPAAYTRHVDRLFARAGVQLQPPYVRL